MKEKSHILAFCPRKLMVEDEVLHFFVQFVDEEMATCLPIPLFQKTNQIFACVLCEKAEDCAEWPRDRIHSQNL